MNISFFFLKSYKKHNEDVYSIAGLRMKGITKARKLAITKAIELALEDKQNAAAGGGGSPAATGGAGGIVRSATKLNLGNAPASFLLFPFSYFPSR